MSGNNPVEQFIEALPAAVSRALAEKSSAAWSFTLDEPPVSFPSGSQLLNLVLVAESSKAEAAIQLTHSSAILLAGGPVGAGSSSRPEPEQAEAVRSAFAKACNEAAQSLGGLQIHLRLEEAIHWSAARRFSLSGSAGESEKVQLQVLLPAGWPESPQAPAKNAFHLDSANISLLQNVELEVTLRFGQQQLSLREIGELRSGSVVELDRYVQDPAELLLGDRVVAKGEVVIVDGNYGLRVTEVV